MFWIGLLIGVGMITFPAGVLFGYRIGLKEQPKKERKLLNGDTLTLTDEEWLKVFEETVKAQDGFLSPGLERLFYGKKGGSEDIAPVFYEETRQALNLTAGTSPERRTWKQLPPRIQERWKTFAEVARRII